MKTSRITMVALAVALLTAAAPALAQAVAVRDEVSLPVPKASLFGSRGPSEELKKEARRQAADKAWQRYKLQGQSAARQEIFQRHDAALRGQIEQLCSLSFYDEVFDSEASSYTVRVRGSCDQAAVDAALNRLGAKVDAAAMAGLGATAGPDKPPIAFLFLARRNAEASVYGDKVSQQRSATASTGATVDAAGLAGVTHSSSTVASSKTDRRDTDYRRVVEQSDVVDSAVTGVLSTAGFDVAKYTDVQGECPAEVALPEIIASFAEPSAYQGETVSPEMRRAMIRAARSCQMGFFATGLMEILKSERLPDNSEMVTVQLTLDVRDIRRAVPTAVAAAKPVQFQQRGRDRLQATQAALVMAAEAGARDIVDMLRQRGIR